MKLHRIAPAIAAAVLIVPIGLGLSAAAAAPGDQSWHAHHGTPPATTTSRDTETPTAPQVSQSATPTESASAAPNTSAPAAPTPSETSSAPSEPVESAPETTTAPTPEPSYTTVLWVMPKGETWPQRLVTWVPRDDLGAFTAGTPGLLCGRNYQADVYRTADVPALGEVLTEGEDYGIALHWNVFQTPACAIVTPPVTTSPTTPPTTPPVITPPATVPPTATPTPTPTVPVETPKPTPTPSAPTTAPTPTRTTPATVVVTDDTPTPQPGAGRRAGLLAYTGSEARPWAIAGLLLILGGVGGLVYRRHMSNREIR